MKKAFLLYVIASLEPMSRIDELIEKHCPDGVEFQKLGEIGTFIRGNGLQKKDFTESGVGCIHYGQIYTYYDLFADKTKSFVSEETAKKLRKAQKGDLIIATTSENIDDVCKPLVWLGEEEICISGETYIFKHNQNPKYLAYYLQTPMFYDYKKQNRTGTKVIRVHGDKLECFSIPLPPLSVQQEIASVLDKFTELEKELEKELGKELEARKKQYEHYLNKLLTFDKLYSGEIIFSSLGNVVKIRNGKDYKSLTEGEIPVYGTGGIMCYVDKATHSGPSVLIPRKGSLKNLYYVDKPFWTVDTIFYTEISDKLNPKFLYYYLLTLRLENLNQAAGIPSLTKSTLDRLQIPIPPLEEQNRIVSILDKFDALVNDISVGLPAEIKMRRQQYEYYRNKLLTFKTKEQ